MLANEISLNQTSSRQITEYTGCEPETSQYMVECYPYAMRGVLCGLLLSIVFWVSVIGLLILMF